MYTERRYRQIMNTNTTVLHRLINNGKFHELTNIFAVRMHMHSLLDYKKSALLMDSNCMNVHFLQHDRPPTGVARCSPGSTDTFMLTHIPKPITNIKRLSTSLNRVATEPTHYQAKGAG
jgi:hypothetical protein